MAVDKNQRCCSSNRLNQRGQEEPIFTRKGLEFYEQKSWADIVGQLRSAEKFRLEWS
jgi:hypothetical protein